MIQNIQTVNAATISAILSATGKVFIGQAPNSQWGQNQVRVMELTLTTETLGFVLSAQLCQTLSHLPVEKIDEIGITVINHLKTSVGAHQVFQPMYPNFPKQVLDASDYELFSNATLHYIGSWLGLRILPKYEKIARSIIEKTPNPKVIELCTEENLKDYIENMVTANVSYSPSQRENLVVIAKFLQEQSNLEKLLTHSIIPNKENLAFWGNMFLSNGWDFQQQMAYRFSTTTDVLRLIATYSGADSSLAKSLKVGKISRANRKVFMNLLECVCNAQNDKEQLIENLLTYRSEWVRIAHAFHIGEYAHKFPESYALLYKLRNNEKITTFNGRVENAYLNGNSQALIDALQTRPGVFARNLTRLLVTEKGEFPKFISKTKKRAINLKTVENERNKLFKSDTSFTSLLAQQLQGLNLQTQPMPQVEVENTPSVEAQTSTFEGIFSHEEKNTFITAFSIVAKDVSTPVLLQVHSHFKHIEEKMNLGGRAFMPKGGLSKMFYQTGSSAKYDTVQCKKIENIVQEVLTARFAQMPHLGKVYIDPALKLQNVPFAMRSAAKALKTVARGSVFNLKDKNNIRLFLWWKEPAHDRVDIDLSASMYGEDFKSLGHCSYWNLRDSGFTHSGDIVSAPNGACEFIDIDRSKIPEGTAYVAMTLSSYSGQKYCDLPECFAGWMERDNLEEGEIFDARTVQNKIDLSSDTTNIMPIVYDVKNNRVIWIDTSYANGSICSNAEGNSDAISMILKSWVETHKPTLYDLFELHAKARGEIVDNPQEAEQIFSIHEGITPYDFDVISSQYMADAK